MSKIDNLISTCTWLLHNDKEEAGLDYLSRIDGEAVAWYFWMPQVAGVYEIKLLTCTTIEDIEKSDFCLKYYPGLDEEVFDCFSCSEQLIRLGDLFDNDNIEIPEDPDVCPCCGGSCKDGEHHHEHEQQHEHRYEKVVRSKGIPKLTQRHLLPQHLFSIATMQFVIIGEKLSEVTLKTQSTYPEYAEQGVVLAGPDGKPQELVEVGGLDRNVPGYQLSKPLFDYLLSKVLPRVDLTVKETIEARNIGLVAHNYGSNLLKYITASETEEIIITNTF